MSNPLYARDRDTGNMVELEAESLGGGKFGLAMASSGTAVQAVPDYDKSSDLVAAYGNFAAVNRAGGDFVTRQAASNGQIFTTLSVSPLTTGESQIVIDAPVKQPCKLELEASLVRNRQNFASIGLFADDVVNDVATPAPVPDPINIVSISQSSATNGAVYSGSAGTVVTLVLAQAVPEWPSTSAVFLSDWVHVNGLVDTRLNYQNAAISYISPDRKTLTFGFADEAALTSLAVPVITPTPGTATLSFYNNAAGAHHGAGYRFTGTTDTSGVVWTVFGGGDAQVSGTLLGDHRIAILSTAAAVTNAGFGQYEKKSTSRFAIRLEPEKATFLERAVDSSTTWAVRTIRSAVKPGSEALLRPRFRIYKPEGMSRPVAKAVSLVKATATTTATINLDQAPVTPLAVGNIVNVYGARDQVNFPATAGPITAVLSPTQFQMVMGPAVIATSYGGLVGIVNGGAAQPGILGQYASSIATNVPGQPEWLNATMNATVSGLVVGMYVDLYAWRQDLTGADLLVDGAWEVAHISTATAWFKPIYDIGSVRISPVTPNIPAAVNCGGAVIIRTTACVHDLIFDGQPGVQRVEIEGMGTSDVSKAIPVNVVLGGITSVTAAQGAAATISATDGTGGWPIRPSIARIADIASAALTTVGATNSAAIVNDKGNGFQVVVPVTAVTGTGPTMDFRVEESVDGGTTYEILYELPRINAVGVYSTPVLFASGGHIRYVRTLGGTTPSFTMSTTRVLLPLSNPTKTCQLFDRAVSLTTLNATTAALLVDNAQDVKLTVDIGAATTAPVITLEGTEDKLKWLPIAPPLTAVASGVVSVTAFSPGVKWVRARVSTVGATVTAGFVQLKGF